MTMRRIIPAAALLAAACAGSAPAPADPTLEQNPQGPMAQGVAPAGEREAPPAPLPPTPVNFPAFHERTLSNGAQVVIVENHEQPVVTVNLQVKSGSIADPAAKVGIAALTARTLDKGTKTRSAERIAETVDFVGGQLNASAGDEFSSVVAVATTQALDTVLTVLADVVKNPTFPADEVEAERKRMLSELQLSASQPSSVAERRFINEVYGPHVYGKLQTPETIQAIQRADLIAYHKAAYRPNNSLIVVAGAVGPDEIVAKLERALAGWTRGQYQRPVTGSVPARGDREIVLVHKPGAAQTVIRLGHTVAPATNPDWPTLDVALQVLGGGSSGWLFQVLREQKGYTYGSYAGAGKKLEPGLFSVSAETRTEVADSALTELIRLLTNLTTQPVPAADLELAKSYITGKFPRDIETPQQVASQVATNRLLGRPDDYLQRYRQRVAAVTAADVQRVAQTHLHPERAVVIVVGDATKLREKLAPFGNVRMVDEQGRPFSMPSAAEASANQVRFEASSLQPSTTIHSVLVQGNPVAELTTTITRETIDGVPAVRVVRSMSGMMRQDADLAIDARDFTPIYSKQEMQQGPVKMVSDTRYENGRIVGTTSGLPQGDVTVDLAAPKGTLLTGMDEVALTAIDYASTKEATFQVYNLMGNSVLPLTAKVIGETKVTTAAGEFEVYQVQVTGGPQPLTLMLRKAAPHILVKQELPGQPVTIELKSIK